MYHYTTFDDNLPMNTAKTNYIPPARNTHVLFLENFSGKPTFANILYYFAKEFFVWWYVIAPIGKIHRFSRMMLVIDDKLSISLLARTFFVPWHSDKSFVGYLVALIIRIIYLPIALSVYLTVAVAYVLLMILWFLLPFLPITMIILTLIGR